MAARRIDLNSDLGEGLEPGPMGVDDTMLSLVSSANVACGGHAGDGDTMYRTVSAAAANGVVVGAHPGYADREGFGRRVIPMSLAQIGRMVADQIRELQVIAARVPVEVRYVKAHGALANLAARDADVADAVVGAVQRVDRGLAVLAISGTEIERVARRRSAPVFSEVFADRGYLSTGELVPRGQPGDLIHDAGEASDRLLGFLESGLMPVVDGEPIALAADSICVHGDTLGAVEMTRRLRGDLAAAGLDVAGFVTAES